MGKRIAIFFPFEHFMTIPSLTAMMEELADQGYEVDLFALFDEQFAGAGSAFKHSRIRLCLVRYDLGLPFRMVPRPLWFLVKIRKFFGRPYELIIGVDAQGIVAAALARKILGVPIAYLSYEIFAGTELPSLKAKVLKKLESWAHSQAALTIVQDEPRRQYLYESNGLEVDPGKVCLVPNSPRGEGKPVRRDYFRQKFALSREQLLILHAGALWEQALPLAVLETAATWPDDWTLICHSKRAEDPADEAVRAIRSHRSYQAGKVKLSLEPVPQDQLELIYGSGDIGLALNAPFSRNVELMGLSSGKIAHYLQCGVPVVASDLAGYRDLLERYQAGICLKSLFGLNEAIENIRDNYSYYQSGAVKCFNEIFALNNYLPAFVDKIKELSHH